MPSKRCAICGHTIKSCRRDRLRQHRRGVRRLKRKSAHTARRKEGRDE